MMVRQVSRGSHAKVTSSRRYSIDVVTRGVVSSCRMNDGESRYTDALAGRDESIYISSALSVVSACSLRRPNNYVRTHFGSAAESSHQMRRACGLESAGIRPTSHGPCRSACSIGPVSTAAGSMRCAGSRRGPCFTAPEGLYYVVGWGPFFGWGGGCFVFVFLELLFSYILST